MGEMEHLSDTQSEKDERNIPIDRVGIKSLRFPVGSEDIVESWSGNVPLPSEVSSVSHPPLVAPPAVVAPMPADSVAAQPTAQPPVNTLAFSPPPK